MKRIILCLGTVIILLPLVVHAGEKRVYTDADLEKYKTSSSSDAKKTDTGGRELQQGKSSEQSEEGQARDSEMNSRRAREASRR